MEGKPGSVLGGKRQGERKCFCEWVVGDGLWGCGFDGDVLGGGGGERDFEGYANG